MSSIRLADCSLSSLGDSLNEVIEGRTVGIIEKDRRTPHDPGHRDKFEFRSFFTAAPMLFSESLQDQTDT